MAPSRLLFKPYLKNKRIDQYVHPFRTVIIRFFFFYSCMTTCIAFNIFVTSFLRWGLCEVDATADDFLTHL